MTGKPHFSAGRSNQTPIGSCTPSTAFENHESTVIGAYLDKLAADHPDQSGFAIIPDGREAFTSRIAMTELAEKTLDLQYFVWDADSTGRILAQYLVQAADRGVRVRILVDDIYFNGRDAILAGLDAHPNIQVRLFNPFAHRSWRMLNFMADFGRLNHRMHNKLFVMDNSIAIVGGRNIGDSYFEVHQDTNFRDMDVFCVGPIVRKTSAVFDQFWNGQWAVPVKALIPRTSTDDELRAVLKTAKEQTAAKPYPYPLDEDVATLKLELESIYRRLIWAQGHMIFDDPDEITAHGRTITMTEGFYRRIERLESELLIEVPYFVVRQRGLEAVRRLRERGVRIQVLTNSLASNNVLAAHAGHAKHREALIAAGVELYELRSDPPLKKTPLHLMGSSSARSTLHCKAFVFDRKDLFIGSLNLDPRSGDINTEAGLYIESPELANQMASYMNQGVQGQISYQVVLNPDGQLSWLSEDEAGNTVRHDRDPKTTRWQRGKARFIGMLPIVDQL